jgi:hypothetical protein
MQVIFFMKDTETLFKQLKKSHFFQKCGQELARFGFTFLILLVAGLLVSQPQRAKLPLKKINHSKSLEQDTEKSHKGLSPSSSRQTRPSSRLHPVNQKSKNSASEWNN